MGNRVRLDREVKGIGLRALHVPKDERDLIEFHTYLLYQSFNIVPTRRDVNDMTPST